MSIIDKILELLGRIFSKKDKKNTSSEPVTHSRTGTYIVAENKELTEGDLYSFKAWLYDQDTHKPLVNKTLHTTIGDKTYDLRSDDTGTYTLPIHLMAKTWGLKTFFDGDYAYLPSSTDSTLYIKPKINTTSTDTAKTKTPKTDVSKTTTKPTTTTKTVTYTPNNKGEYWNPRFLTGAEGKQNNNYYCAPFSIMEAWYELFGEDLSQTHIAKLAGTTQNGTGHSGINNALDKLQKEHNHKIKYEWKNFSEVGWDKLAQYCRNPKISFIIHGGWAPLGSWDFESGHYYTLACINPKAKYVYEIYSLMGDNLQKRSFDYIKASVGYISQPSLCIITKL